MYISGVVSWSLYVYFRGRLLIAIKTEISDSIDTAPSEVEVEPTHTINEVNLEKLTLKKISKISFNLKVGIVISNKWSSKRYFPCLTLLDFCYNFYISEKKHFASYLYSTFVNLGIIRLYKAVWGTTKHAFCIFALNAFHLFLWELDHVRTNLKCAQIIFIIKFFLTFVFLFPSDFCSNELIFIH